MNQQLRDAAKSYLEDQPEFELGDIVVWKDGLKDKRRPEYDVECIVVAVSPGQLTPSGDMGAHYACTLADVSLMHSDEDGNMLGYWYDQKRFRKIGKL